MPAQRIAQGFKTVSENNPITTTLLPAKRLERVQQATIAYVERALTNGDELTISRQSKNLADRLDKTTQQIATKAGEKYADILALSPDGKLIAGITSGKTTQRIIETHKLEREFAQFQRFAKAFANGIR